MGFTPFAVSLTTPSTWTEVRLARWAVYSNVCIAPMKAATRHRRRPRDGRSRPPLRHTAHASGGAARRPRWDAEGRRYEDIGDLFDYAMRVAGTVGAMMTLMMGVRTPQALARACDLG